MRFVAGRDAVAEVLLVGAPLRRCCWPGHRGGGTAGRAPWRSAIGKILAVAPVKTGRGVHGGAAGRDAVAATVGGRGGHINEELRPAGQPSVSRALVHKKEDDLRVMVPLSPFYQARLAAPRIAASDSFSDEGKTFTFPRQKETTSSSIYF